MKKPAAIQCRFFGERMIRLKNSKINCKLRILLLANAVVILVFQIFSHFLATKEQLFYSTIVDMSCFVFMQHYLFCLLYIVK